MTLTRQGGRMPQTDLPDTAIKYATREYPKMKSRQRWQCGAKMYIMWGEMCTLYQIFM